MPSFRGVFIDSIKFFRGLYPSKMFDFANDGDPQKTYTASLFLPLARLAEITFLPFLVFILVLNPCVLFLGVLCGWYVLFILNHPSMVFTYKRSISSVSYNLDAIVPYCGLRDTNIVLFSSVNGKLFHSLSALYVR